MKNFPAHKVINQDLLCCLISPDIFNVRGKSPTLFPLTLKMSIWKKTSSYLIPPDIEDVDLDFCLGQKIEDLRHFYVAEVVVRQVQGAEMIPVNHRTGLYGEERLSSTSRSTSPP